MIGTNNINPNAEVRMLKIMFPNATRFFAAMPPIEPITIFIVVPYSAPNITATAVSIGMILA